MFIDKTEQEQNELKLIINRLIAINFLTKETERELYLLARRNRIELEQFFLWLNWEFILDDRNECIFVASQEFIHRRNLNREESIWLLILRLIYQEKRQTLSLSDCPLTTIHEIRTKYATFRISFPNKSRLSELIRFGALFKLIAVIDEEFYQDDCRLRLFHTIFYIFDSHSIETITSKLDSYDMTEEEDTNEMAQEG